ncbi:TOM core complex subunit [Phialemonium atrogriseum]|uniref:TOM core complex subunit n=1 Tax=Phialemonium atrogriseum TaxID=1093897 RepID=A0AAJ0BR34_9PEZI|nr:TOM core complex subunit [Phialemonium atrogriseum]KAK1762923.1 TOM core complex subunit [Phialemonium atrogriseum]
MPPKRILVEKAGGSRRGAPKGIVRTTYDTLTSPENRPVVTSIAAFGTAVTFLSSAWAEFLLVPQ